MCVFRAQNNKSNDLYLLVMAQRSWRNWNWTRKTLGTCPQWASGREEENTDLFQHTSMRKTCKDRFMMTFKDIKLVSTQEVACLYVIPVMLHQQQCWKFASGRTNFGTLQFCILCCQNVAFSESWSTSAAWLRSEMCGGNCVVMTMWGGVVRCRTAALLSAEASCYTVAVVIPCSCSNTQHCLKLPTCYCTSVSTMSIDMPDRQVIIIAVTDGYTGLLLVPVSISFPWNILYIWVAC